MVGLLVLASASEAIEMALADHLDAILDAGKLPDLARLEEEFASKPSPSSEVAIPEPNLQVYNRLLSSACEVQL